VRALGILIVVLVLGLVGIQILISTVIRPELRRRRTERLFRENEELDRQLEAMRQPPRPEE
jgi:hypothetical protein